MYLLILLLLSAQSVAKVLVKGKRIDSRSRQATPAFTSRPNYTYVHCIEGDGLYDPRISITDGRSCIYYNACVQRKIGVQGQWSVKVHTKEDIKPADIRLALYTRNRGSRDNNWNGFAQYDVDIVKTPIPNDAILIDRPLVISAGMGLEGNIGHMLYEILIPSFTLARSFDVDPAKAMFMVIDLLEVRRKDVQSMFGKWSGAFDLRNLSQWLERTGGMEEKKEICVPELVMGTGALSGDCVSGSMNGNVNQSDWCNYGRGPVYGDFRKYVMKQMEVEDQFHFRRGVTVLVCLKSTERFYTDDALKALAKHIGQSRKYTVVTLILHHFPFQEQLRELARATVVISICGGSAMFFALFARKHSTFIMLCQNSTLLDWSFIKTLGHIKAVPISFYAATNLKHKIDFTPEIYKKVLSEVESAASLQEDLQNRRKKRGTRMII